MRLIMKNTTKNMSDDLVKKLHDIMIPYDDDVVTDGKKWYNNWKTTFDNQELEKCLTLQIELNKNKVLKSKVINYCKMEKDSWSEINKECFPKTPNTVFDWVLPILRKKL